VTKQRDFVSVHDEIVPCGGFWQTVAMVRVVLFLQLVPGDGVFEPCEYIIVSWMVCQWMKDEPSDNWTRYDIASFVLTRNCARSGTASRLQVAIVKAITNTPMKAMKARAFFKLDSSIATGLPAKLLS